MPMAAEAGALLILHVSQSPWPLWSKLRVTEADNVHGGQNRRAWDAVVQRMRTRAEQRARAHYMSRATGHSV